MGVDRLVAVVAALAWATEAVDVAGLPTAQCFGHRRRNALLGDQVVHVNGPVADMCEIHRVVYGAAFIAVDEHAAGRQSAVDTLQQLLLFGRFEVVDR
ncbi:MAG: hypothetical protein R3C10_04385 [Pirellulales bacterium]